MQPVTQGRSLDQLDPLKGCFERLHEPLTDFLNKKIGLFW